MTSFEQDELKVVVIGSRNWPQHAVVTSFVRGLALKHPRAIVISGGAPGVDTVAERDSIAAGLRVASLVVKQEQPPSPRIHTAPDDNPPDYRKAPCWIELHEYEVGASYGYPTRVTNLGHVLSSRNQALAFRTKLTVRQGTQIMAYQYRDSRGTQLGIDEAVRLGHVEGKTLHVTRLP